MNANRQHRSDNPSSRSIECKVREAVAECLARIGSHPLDVAEVLNGKTLGCKDFAALGLTSLDWMQLATRLETEFGVEFSDSILLDADRRNIAGWSSYLSSVCAASGGKEPIS